MLGGGSARIHAAAALAAASAIWVRWELAGEGVRRVSGAGTEHGNTGGAKLDDICGCSNADC